MFYSQCLLAILAFSVSPLSSTLLTDPGPLCDGQSATLTCNITGGSRLEWDYEAPGGMTVRVATINPTLGSLPSSDPVSVLGVEFTVSLLNLTSPHFVSRVSFQASTMMNEGALTCTASVSMFDERVSLHVVTSPGPPGNVRLSNFMNGTNTSDVTIQWTPPSGGSVAYTIVVTPPPISGVVMDTSNTEVTVTVLYNTPYTTSVSTSTPCPGPTQEISFILVACEFPVGVSIDVTLPISGSAQTLYPEGSEIMYQCRPGFQPQNITVVCGNIGGWAPDPASLQCLVDCNDPVLPSNANGRFGEVTSTIEGSTVNFQCDEGFVPSGHNTTQIQCTRVNNAGLWIQNPETLICIVNCSDLVLPSNANGSIGEVTSTTEGSVVNFQCEEGQFLSSGQSAALVQCTNVNNMGQWMPNTATLVCSLEATGVPVTTLIETGPTSESASSSTNESGSGAGQVTSDNTPIIIGVVVVVVAALMIATAVIIILICVKYRQATKQSEQKQNGVEMQVATPEHKAEYHTLQSRGYNADQAEYDTVHRDHQVNKTAGGEEYSEVRPDSKLRNVRKANVPSGDVSEYSQLNSNPAPPDPSSNLVYADLGTAMPQKKKKKPEAAATAAPVVDQDKVVYAAIDPKATAALKKEIDAKKIPACNLDIMLIQVKKEVAPLWYEYGVVLALPDNVLKDIMDLEMSDNDKLVEVLDYWFRKFPPGGGPTWKEVSLSIREIGLISLADKLLKVETTGELPIEVSTRVEALEVKDAMPPPVPPKMDSDQEALIPPPRTGSLKQQPPPRPPKAGTQTLPAAPPRPPKTQPSHLPARPPKPGLT